MRKIIALCLGILLAVGFVAVPAQKASAADATTVFIELTGSSSEIFSTTYLRGRVLALDANGALATTFGGGAIADATLELQAVSSTSFAQWSTDGVNNLNPTFSYTGSEKAAINLDAAYQEFAVRFYNPTTGATPENIGAEVIRATLKKGTSTISADANITIKAPEANCFVVRSGQIATLPGVLDEIPVRQNNSGATNSAGQSVTANVFAAKYYLGKYFFTDNVPKAITSITVLGAYIKASTAAAIVTGTTAQTYTSNLTIVSAITDPTRALSSQIAVAVIPLTAGYGSATATVQNLQIPAILNIEGLTATANAAAMAGILDGYTIYWYPVPTVTRKIGNKSGDVNTADQVSIAATSIVGLMDTTAFNDFDTTIIKPADATKISIIGLPVNEVNGSGSYLEAGIGGAEMAAGTLDINPLDAYYLLEDWKTKPSSFKVAAKQNANFIYGAIVAQDTYGNPAPFYVNDTVRFELKTTSSGTAINSATAELRAANGTSWATSGVATAGAITATNAYQAFLPFQITATAASGSASIADLYISAAKRGSNYALLSSSLTSDIDTSAEGVSFFGQQYVGAITPTTNFDTAFQGKEAAEEGSFQVMGSASEKSFDMRAVHQGKAVKFGAKGITAASSAVTSITLPTDTGNLAKQDVAVCTALAKNKKAYLMFKGTSNNTLAVIPVTLTTASMTAADPGDFGISLIIANPLTAAKVYLDDEGDHQTAVIGSGNFLVYDGFSNKFGCLSYTAPGVPVCADTALTIEDADLEAMVYQVDEFGVATATAFDGASADINGNTIEVEFDLPKITAAQDAGSVTIAPEGGSPSGAIAIYTQALQTLELEDIFVPVQGINNTPIKAYFADQAGAKTLPVTQTAVTYGAKGSRFDVELEVDPEDNGSITAAATEYIYTADPTVTNYDNTVRFTARINSAFDSMAIVGQSDAGDKTLTLAYNADFEKPVIVDPLVAIDCGFEITITDNIDVDAAATVVTVKNASGEDITSTVLQSVASDNGTQAVIQIKGTGTGSFTVAITAKDAAGNEQTGSKIVSVTSATDCAIGPECVTVDPAVLQAGDPTTEITVTGKNTNFAQGTTVVAIDCPATDITLSPEAVTVNSSSELTFNVTPPTTVDAAATCDITVTTGEEVIACEDKIEVVPAGALCVDNDNDTYGEGCDAGADCNDNDSAINPGAEDICEDGIDQDCSGADAECPILCNLSVSNETARAGFILPRIYVTFVSGDSEDFDARGTVSFTDGITKILQLPLGSRILVIGLVAPSAKGTTVTVSVEGCDGTAEIAVN